MYLKGEEWVEILETASKGLKIIWHYDDNYFTVIIAQPYSAATLKHDKCDNTVCGQGDNIIMNILVYNCS